MGERRLDQRPGEESHLAGGVGVLLVDDALVDAALERAAAWAAAGADGLFVPGLADEARIARLCAASPLPVNLFARPDGPSLVRLAELGAARISHGPIPWKLAMKALAEAARAAHGAVSGLSVG